MNSCSSSDAEWDELKQQVVIKKFKSDDNNQLATALIEIPFKTSRLAEIAFNSLSVDKGPKGEIKELTFEDNKLIARFKAEDSRSLRLSLNSFLDFTSLVSKTIDRFDLVDKSQSNFKNE